MATIQENLAGLFKRGEAQVFCLQIDICHDNGGMMMIMIYVMMIINIIITTMPRCGQGTSMLSPGKITPRLVGQGWLRYSHHHRHYHRHYHNTTPSWYRKKESVWFKILSTITHCRARVAEVQSSSSYLSSPSSSPSPSTL